MERSILADAAVLAMFYALLLAGVYLKIVSNATRFSELFFLVPVIYIIIRDRKVVGSFKVAALVGFFLGPIYLIGSVVNAWDSPLALKNILNANYIVLWSVYFALWAVSLYQHFLEKQSIAIDSGTAKKLLLLSLSLLLAANAILIVRDAAPIQSLRSTYSYELIVVPFLFLPVAYMFARFKKIKDAAILALLTAAPLLVYELLIAAYYHFWSYTAKYAYAFSIFGASIPLEELVFWDILGPVSVVSYCIIVGKLRSQNNKSGM